MTRYLLVGTRQPAAGDDDRIDAAWARLRDAVQAAGGRAWRFRSADEPRRLLEFVEWKQDAGATGVPAEPDVAAALEALEHLAPCTARETWEEAP